jgi:hypothetical protein
VNRFFGRKILVGSNRFFKMNLKEITEALEAVIDALRLSYIALLMAGSEAEERGDKKSMRYFDKQAKMARKALEGIDALADRKRNKD